MADMSASWFPLLLKKEFLSMDCEKWKPLKVPEQESRCKELNMTKYFCLGLNFLVVSGRRLAVGKA